MQQKINLNRKHVVLLFFLIAWNFMNGQWSYIGDANSIPVLRPGYVYSRKVTEITPNSFKVTITGKYNENLIMPIAPNTNPLSCPLVSYEARLDNNNNNQAGDGLIPFTEWGNVVLNTISGNFGGNDEVRLSYSHPNSGGVGINRYGFGSPISSGGVLYNTVVNLNQKPVKVLWTGNCIVAQGSASSPGFKTSTVKRRGVPDFAAYSLNQGIPFVQSRERVIAETDPNLYGYSAISDNNRQTIYFNFINKDVQDNINVLSGPPSSGFCFNSGSLTDNTTWNGANGRNRPAMSTVTIVFTIYLKCPPPPSNLNTLPVANQSLSQLLSWGSVTNSSGYQVQWAKKNESYITTGSNTQAANGGQAILSSNSLNITLQNLLKSTEYKWRVRTKCKSNADVYSNWGEEKYFSIGDCDPATSFELPLINNTNLCVIKTCGTVSQMAVPSPTILADPTTILYWVGNAKGFDFSKMVTNASNLEVYIKKGDKWEQIPNPLDYKPLPGIAGVGSLSIEKFALIQRSALSPTSNSRCFIGMVGLDIQPFSKCYYMATAGSNLPYDQPCYQCNYLLNTSEFAFMKLQLEVPCINTNVPIANKNVYDLSGFRTGTTMTEELPQTGSFDFSAFSPFSTQQINSYLKPKDAYNITINNVESITPAENTLTNAIWRNTGIVNNFYTFKWVPKWNQSRNQSYYIFSATPMYSAATLQPIIKFKSGARIESYNPNGPGNSSFLVFGGNGSLVFQQPLPQGNPAAAPGRRDGSEPDMKYYSIPNNTNTGGQWVQQYPGDGNIADLLWLQSSPNPLQCMTYIDNSERYELKPADPANPLKWKQTISGCTTTGDYQLTSVGSTSTICTLVPSQCPSNFNKFVGKRVKVCNACPAINFNNIILTPKLTAGGATPSGLTSAQISGETSFNINIAAGGSWPCDATSPFGASTFYAYDIDMYQLQCPTVVPCPSSAARIANDITKTNDDQSVEFQLSKIFIAPNPVQNELTVELQTVQNGKANYVVSDATGNIANRGEIVCEGGACRSTIDTSALKQGLHILQVTINGEVLTSKFIKK